jgi:hypothetical protein
MHKIASLLIMSTFAMSHAQPAPSPRFCTTQNSNDWVDRSIQVQQKYSRVLVVTASTAPATVEVAPLDLNNPTARPAPTRYKVDQVFSTLQAAGDAAEGGDLVAIMPGTYAGMFLREKASCGDGKYIHFKAMGPPGQVIINNWSADAQGNPLSRHMIHLFASHHVILQGLHLVGQTGPGLPQAGPTSGIMIGASFIHTRKMTHHIVLTEIFSHNHRTWGMHSTDSYTVLMQDSCFALSCKEHSAYVSDGSDDYVIRRNIFFGSGGCGLQCNIDPDTCLRKMSGMEEFAELAPLQGNRQWAESMLKLATRKFGKYNFPDGIGENFIIEENVINGNGRFTGGAGLNLAALTDSLIQNNLIYDNYAHGFAMWDNNNVFERTAMKPGPASAAEITGPDGLPLFGCRNNLIRNNTVLMNVPERYALGAINGSYGCTLRNNVAVNDGGPSLEVTGNSVYKLDSGYNVLHSVLLNRYSMWSTVPYSSNTPAMPADIAALATHLDKDNHSALDIDLGAFGRQVVRYSTNSWIIIENGSWRLNPDRPDFHPRGNSQLLSGTGDRAQLPPADLDHRPRASADIGCYRAAEKD